MCRFAFVFAVLACLASAHAASVDRGVGLLDQIKRLLVDLEQRNDPICGLNMFDNTAGISNSGRSDGDADEEGKRGGTSDKYDQLLRLLARVVGGQIVRPGQFPWIAHMAIGYEGKWRQCGASIVSEYWLVTAAHCFETEGVNLNFPLNSIFLSFGEHNIEVLEGNEVIGEVAATIMDPRRKPGSRDYDVAMIKLKNPLTWSKYVRPICLPEQASAPDQLTGMGCIAAGWGDTVISKRQNLDTSKFLKAVEVFVQPPDECPRGGRPTQICTLAKTLSDVCRGDSGGPLMCHINGDKRYTLAGIVSFGPDCKDVLAGDVEPGYFARVGNNDILNFIKTTMANN